MNWIKIPTPVDKLLNARMAIRKAEDHYDEVKKQVLSFDPKITERSTILCTKCGKRSQIKNVTFSRYYWYEKPYSCMGGAMWHSKAEGKSLRIKRK